MLLAQARSWVIIGHVSSHIALSEGRGEYLLCVHSSWHRANPVKRPLKAIDFDAAFQKEAERLLATVRRIKKSTVDERDPRKKRRNMGLLRSALRKFTTYREGLEALRGDPYIDRALEQQIQVIMLLEDECRLESQARRPV